MLSNEMYETFYNDLEDKPFELETVVETTIEIPITLKERARSKRRSTPTAASLFFCLPVERAETAITETPTAPKIFVEVEGGILRHDIR